MAQPRVNAVQSGSESSNLAGCIKEAIRLSRYGSPEVQSSDQALRTYVREKLSFALQIEASVLSDGKKNDARVPLEIRQILDEVLMLARDSSDPQTSSAAVTSYLEKELAIPYSETAYHVAMTGRIMGAQLAWQRNQWKGENI